MYWCSTRVNNEGTHIQGVWGICGEGCPLEANLLGKRNDVNVAASNTSVSLKTNSYRGSCNVIHEVTLYTYGLFQVPALLRVVRSASSLLPMREKYMKSVNQRKITSGVQFKGLEMLVIAVLTSTGESAKTFVQEVSSVQSLSFLID